MLVRQRTMLRTLRATLCAMLALLVTVTPLGSYAHMGPSGADFRADLCTAGTNPAAAPAMPMPPDPLPGTHSHCGDCSTCSIGVGARDASSVPAIRVAANAASVVAAAPARASVRGVVSRPRGPPPPA